MTRRNQSRELDPMVRSSAGSITLFTSATGCWFMVVPRGAVDLSSNLRSPRLLIEQASARICRYRASVRACKHNVLSQCYEAER